MAKAKTKNANGVDRTPGLQPAGFDKDSQTHQFETAEIMHWDNGAWGRAGYAIPNDGGKATTSNNSVLALHDFIGAELFSLMHQDDVKFSRPPNAEWLFSLNKMLELGIKRLSDQSIGWADKRDGDTDHSSNSPQTFTVYPIPFFGKRIRQKHALKWAAQVMLLLSEIMQHSDNDLDDNLTDFIVGMVQEKLIRIRNDIAMLYLGFTRAQVEADDFVIPPDSFSRLKYKPAKNFTSREMVNERMPAQWWPSTNDLTPINGIPSTLANSWAVRWPVADGFYGDGGAVESAFPGSGIGLVKQPGSRT